MKRPVNESRVGYDVKYYWIVEGVQAGACLIAAAVIVIVCRQVFPPMTWARYALSIWGLFALLSSAVAWAVIRRHDRQRERELSAREAEQKRNGGA